MTQRDHDAPLAALRIDILDGSDGRRVVDWTSIGSAAKLYTKNVGDLPTVLQALRGLQTGDGEDAGAAGQPRFGPGKKKTGFAKTAHVIYIVSRLSVAQKTPVVRTVMGAVYTWISIESGSNDDGEHVLKPYFEQAAKVTEVSHQPCMHRHLI